MSQTTAQVLFHKSVITISTPANGPLYHFSYLETRAKACATIKM